MDNDLIFESNNKSTLDKDFKPIKKVPYKVLDFNKANSEYIKDDFKDINFILKTKKGEILIDSRTNTVIGYILVKDNGVMGPLWVDKKYRGQGFGDLLFKDGVEQYGGKELGVYKDNEVATKIYKKYGFKQSEDNKDWIKMVKEDTALLKGNILITDKVSKNGNIYPSELLNKIMEASMEDNKPEIINEDINEISPEAVAEGDYFMRCLREGKDPFETKALNEAAMEANQKIINESAGDPVPMVGMQQPIIVTKMYKNIYNQDDSKIYIANNYKFDTIFEPDGIGTALECSLANSTLTADDLKSENTKIINITQEQYDSFVELTKEGYTFNEALEEVFLLIEANQLGSIKSKFVVVIEHMLKWKYAQFDQCYSWCNSCRYSIEDINNILKPSMYKDIFTPKETIKIYNKGRADAIKHMKDQGKYITIPENIEDIILEDLRNLLDIYSVYNFFYNNRNKDRKESIEAMQQFAEKIGVNYDTKGDPRYFRY